MIKLFSLYNITGTVSTFPPPVGFITAHGLWIYGTNGTHSYQDVDYCGNNKVSLYEDCDDGNTDPLDGCDNCLLEYCGDGIINNHENENCDGGDLCPNTCICPPNTAPNLDRGCTELCGNGEWDEGEECEISPLCLDDCTCPPPYTPDGLGECVPPYLPASGIIAGVFAGIIFVLFMAVLIRWLVILIKKKC